jgi:hypothetical protein
MGINRENFKGELIKHPRKNMWGEVVVPSRAYHNFKELRSGGFYHPRYKWKHCCKAYRKKIRKMKIAKLSRKGLKKRVKRAR